MADTALELVGGGQRILVEGRFAEAQVFVRALASLRPDDQVYVSNAEHDVSYGALRLIDSTLALQLPNGRWLDTPDPNPTHYLELDALYALKVARDLVPSHRRDDIERSLDRYIEVVDDYWATQRDGLFALHPHRILSAAGIFGLFQQHRPEQFPDGRTWSDIFSDRSLYRTDRVEVLG